MHRDLTPLQLDIVKAINLADYEMLVRLGVSGLNEEKKENESDHSETIDIDQY